MRKNTKWRIATILAMVFLISNGLLSVIAASHNPEDPTVLALNQAYTSNAYYGDEYYTFTLDEESDVCIWLGRVAINHTYIMTLSGNSIEPISTADAYNDALTVDTVLEPGVYYIKVDPDFDGLQKPRTEPDETWYEIIVSAAKV